MRVEKPRNALETSPTIFCESRSIQSPEEFARKETCWGIAVTVRKERTITLKEEKSHARKKKRGGKQCGGGRESPEKKKSAETQEGGPRAPPHSRKKGIVQVVQP